LDLLGWKEFLTFSRRWRQKNRRPARLRRELLPATKIDKPPTLFHPVGKGRPYKGRTGTPRATPTGGRGATNKGATPPNPVVARPPALRKAGKRRPQGEAEGRRRNACPPDPAGREPAVYIKSLPDMQLIFYDRVLMCAARDGKTNR
jgi:hypothetical protein